MATQDPILPDPLEAVRNELNDFTYTVSHDLGAPLRSVVSFSKLIQQKYEHSLDDKGKHYLEFVTSGGEKAQAMLQGLLQYSRLRTQAKPPEPVNISALVEKCRIALKDRISACAAFLIADSPLPIIEADPDQLFMLFMAVLNNSLTYRRPDVALRIVITASETQDNWKFTIEDNGIGIPAAQSTRIFGLFKRLHTDEEYAGIGMGLTLSRRIVERHGGTIGTLLAESGGVLLWFTLAKSQTHHPKEASRD